MVNETPLVVKLSVMMILDSSERVHICNIGVLTGAPGRVAHMKEGGCRRL